MNDETRASVTASFSPLVTTAGARLCVPDVKNNSVHRGISAGRLAVFVCLHRVAEAGSGLVQCCNGSVSRCVRVVGSECFSTRIDAQRVTRHWFDDANHFPRIHQLIRLFPQGAPADVHMGGDIDAELANTNSYTSVYTKYAF